MVKEGSILRPPGFRECPADQSQRPETLGIERRKGEFAVAAKFPPVTGDFAGCAGGVAQNQIRTSVVRHLQSGRLASFNMPGGWPVR